MKVGSKLKGHAVARPGPRVSKDQWEKRRDASRSVGRRVSKRAKLGLPTYDNVPESTKHDLLQSCIEMLDGDY